METYNLIINQAPTICGILFISAAYLNSEHGKIFLATLLYLIADCMILLYSLYHGDEVGALVLLIAILFTCRVVYKMQKGLYHKQLKKLEDAVEHDVLDKG